MADMFPGDRVPPRNIEAEQAVLGSMLLDNEMIYIVSELLLPDDFLERAHRLIYEAILYLSESGSAVDLVTVTEELRRQDKLELAGGPAYIASIAAVVPSSANAEYYANIVAEKATLRSLITAAGEIAAQCYEEAEDVEYILDNSEQKIFSIGQRRAREGFSPIKQVLAQTYESIKHVYEHKGEVTGVPTFLALDKFLSGLQKNDLVICAARPGMGKTSFCLNIAQNAAVRHGKSVAIFSLEMSKEQVVHRMLSYHSHINQQNFRTGFLKDEEWPRLVNAMETLSDTLIFIDDTPALNALQVRSKARRLKAEKGLDLVIVDYLQLMSGHKRTDNRQQEIAMISRALKSLARELETPVLALSQLNRGVEQRQDKRPVMADLLESGAIEADADVVLFLYRDEYYNKDSDKKGTAEVIIGKHRNGPVGTVELGFFPDFTQFYDLSTEPEP